MIKYRPFNWFFYGHFLIALAAAGLSAVSMARAFGFQYLAEGIPVILFLFTATLGVYTLHRFLSFRRAGVRPITLRYNIVDRHPWASLTIGTVSLSLAGVLILPYLQYVWHHLVWAIPITVFYLTPLRKGWRRLRDLPYLKVIWVALAWTLMTSIIPVEIMRTIYAEIIRTENPALCVFGGIQNPHLYDYSDMGCRFLFTGSIALLFDFRDTVLDRSQGVKTVANTYPLATKVIVSVAMLICAFLSSMPEYCVIEYQQILSPVTYLTVIPFAWATNKSRPENWYAVAINGLLLGPVVAMVVSAYLG